MGKTKHPKDTIQAPTFQQIQTIAHLHAPLFDTYKAKEGSLLGVAAQV